LFIRRKLTIKVESPNAAPIRLLQSDNEGTILPHNPANWLILANLCKEAYERDEALFVNTTDLTVNQAIGWDNPGMRRYVLSDARANLILAIKGTSISLPFASSDTIPTNEIDMQMVLFPYVMNLC
jgi:putative lipase involved disintegration of autophagic bodies